MAVTSDNNKTIWDILIESGLVDQTQCRKWQVEYRRDTVGAMADDRQAVTAWLVGRKLLTRYQGKLLLRGEGGRLVYGPYVVRQRVRLPVFRHAFEAQHRPSGFLVWLQFLGGELVRSMADLALAESSIRYLCSLDHPALHRWYEYRIEGPYRFVVTDPLSGRLLSEQLAEGKPTRQQACFIGQRIAEALSYLHAHRMVHGHVRPDQIWLSSSGHALLLLGPLVPNWPLGSLTPEQLADYRAPEYLQPGYQPQPISDIYALGCVMYQLLTGQVPFPGGTAQEKLYRHAREPIKPLEEQGVPRELARLVTYLLAKNPAVRTKDLQQVAQQLEQFAEGEADRCPPPVVPAGREAFLRALAQSKAAPVQAAPIPQAPVPVPVATPPTPGPVAPPGVAPAMAQWNPTMPVAGRPAAEAVPAAAPGQPLPVAVAVPAAGTAPLPVAQLAPAALTGANASPAVAVAQAMPAAAGVSAQMPQGTVSPPRPLVQVAPPRRRRRSRGWGVWLGVAVVLGAAIASVYFAQQYLAGPQAEEKVSGSAVEPDTTTGPDQATPSPEEPASDSSSTAGSGTPAGLATDDGVSLWASPTSGQPWSMDLVPLEPLLVLALRPADLAASAEGARVIKAFGPAVETLISQWPERAAGVAWNEIDKLLISLHEDLSGGWRSSMVIYLRQPLAREELLQRWGNPAAQDVSGVSYYVGTSWAYFIEPDSVTVARFAMGRAEQMRELAERRGAPPSLYPGWDALVHHSDSERLATLFFITHHLQTKFLRDGQSYYFGDARKLRDVVDAFWSDIARIGMVSAHVNDSFSYIESILVPDPTIDRTKAVEDLRSRVRAWGEQAEAYLAELQPPPYWARVALRYPTMLRFLAKHTRVQIEDNLIVMNAVLPPAALHNLVFGAEMMLASEPGGIVAAGGEQPAPQAAVPQTIEELLDQKITVRFDQTSLEFAMRDVAAAANDAFPKLPFTFEIVLLGMDMQKDGITKNQSIRDFNMSDAKISEILTALVMRGNPDPTVKAPHEPNQKLVWCVGEDPNRAGQRVVLITTRQGAEERKLTLPKVFTQTE
ncbi:MAG: hypothetical protein KatS3mg110_1160 [Pirellulaceae bacterium]|nr:MAG: hypothetical protein KatS3mg110_1160 [Pirellulaceae bacterium]